jgi:pimeloyl-ACP methyl ester carboxylesterase
MGPANSSNKLWRRRDVVKLLGATAITGPMILRGTTASAAASKVIKIGHVSPQTGVFASFAEAALMDALKIAKAIVAGYDWGARAANIIAALWPDRCRGTYFFNVLPKIRTKSPVLGLREIEARIQGAGPFLFQLPELSSRLRPTPLGLGMRPSEHSLTAGWSPMRNPKLREVSDGA